MSTANEGYAPVGFADVAEGDELRFVTRDTGFGGRGLYVRDGRVTAVTPKTVRLWCDDDTSRGTVAVLRRADWHSRAVLRKVAQEPKPTVRPAC